MFIQFVTILLSVIGGVLYFFICYRVITGHFQQYNYPFNNATKLLVSITYIAFAIALSRFSGPAILLFQSHYVKELFVAILLFFALFLIAFIVGFVIFRLAGIITQITIKENEKAELAKNNYHIAGFHGIVHLFFVLLLTEPIVQMILSMLSKA